jgi:hypothetical protein
MKYQNMKRFYKLARPDGWDFYTGGTINYRENIGETVVCPKFNKDGNLCTSAFIHASRDPNQCFVGASIPCSAYLVRGIPILEDTDKCGFGKLYIEKEVGPENLFKWNYELACNPVKLFKIKPPKIIKKHIELANKWASVRNSVNDSVNDSVEASVNDSVRNSVETLVRDSTWASMGASTRAQAWVQAWAPTWDSVWDSVWAYIGFIFIPVVKKWKHINYKKGEYPFQSAVDLWNMGLVLSVDGNILRLHGGEGADILWEGNR